MQKHTWERTDSFTSKVKSELSRLKIRRFEDARALLCAFTLCIGSLKFVQHKRCWGIHYSLKSRETIEYCAKLLSQYYELECSITEVRHERLNANNCELLAFGNGGIDVLLQSVGMTSTNEKGEMVFEPSIPDELLVTDTQMRSFVRGLFLACGMAADPEKAYHIEFVVNSEALADKATEVLALYGIITNSTKRKNNIVLYVKDGDTLENLLAFIGASEAMMHVSNERIIKQAHNSANRYVNCTTANVNRATATAGKQAEDINLILTTLGVEALSNELMTVAMARMNNFELSLSELADELEIGRSAVNYRLKKLEKMADEIRKSIKLDNQST